MRERKKGRHLTWNDRLMIERLLLSGEKIPRIAEIIGCCRATIYNEVKRATYIHTNSDLTTTKRYNPDQAQLLYEQALKEKGPKLKIQQDENLKKYLEAKIGQEKFSPAAALMKIPIDGHSFSVEIKSVNTIYSYIKKGVFPTLTLDHLSYRRKKHKKARVRKSLEIPKANNIAHRPEVIEDRMEFGHWEMDTVIGKKSNKKNLLVLTERKSRYEIIEVLKSREKEEVRKALNRIEKRYGTNFYRIFKTVTCDNGVEFRGLKEIEKALLRKGKRFDLYYANPYHSWERGSNENNNKLIRKFLPKGSNFDKLLTRRVVIEIEQWINDYPRVLLNKNTSKMVFVNEVNQLTGS